MIIPKIIHQIWIGPNKRPDVWMDTVRDFCIKYDFEYMLWDEERIYKLEMTNRTFYDDMSSYNGKSDILRYEILYKYGGVYVDADTVFTKFEKLHNILNAFDSDAGFGFERDGELIAGGISISVKNSSFMKKCIEALPYRNFTLLPWISVGPSLITDVYQLYGYGIRVTLYPSKTFYPISWHGISTIDMHSRMILPDESVMFQYGYSTNNLSTLINKT